MTRNTSLIRAVDCTISIIGLVSLSPLFLVLVIFGFLDTGSPIFSQRRIGLAEREFTLYKLRTMKVGTADLSTHCVPESSITDWGRFLRKTKLDELPQLFNILLGHMSLVGPRPCLPTQQGLLDSRRVRGVFKVRPGLTGLAQIFDVDMATPHLLSKVDQYMIQRMSFTFYIALLVLTFLKLVPVGFIRVNFFNANH